MTELNTNSWAVRYRPQKFREVVGQKTVVSKLIGMIKREEFPNAILLTGPSGTGKTSLARLLAKYINCETSNSCGKCISCLYDINSHPDFIEINASEQRGIDDIRSLVQQSRFKPQHKLRIILIDECHNITGAAANAFLKPLEEPPDASLWILATTDPQKLLPTILGRCNRLDLTTVQVEDIVVRLKYIAEQENMGYIDEALCTEIAQSTGGQVRNAIQALEGVYNYVNGLNKVPATEILIKEIKSVVLLTTDVALEKISTKILLGIYLNRPSVVCSALVDSDESQIIQLANRLLWANQYILDNKVYDKPSKNIWHTQNNRDLLAIVNKKIPDLDIDMILQAHKLIVKLRGELQTFAVPAKALAVAILAGGLI